MLKFTLSISYPKFIHKKAIKHNTIIYYYKLLLEALNIPFGFWLKFCLGMSLMKNQDLSIKQLLVSKLAIKTLLLLYSEFNGSRISVLVNILGNT